MSSALHPFLLDVITHVTQFVLKVTPRYRGFPEKLVVTQLVKRLSTFMEFQG
jgi:hypothetical protein